MTIYKRGLTYALYYREVRRSVRRNIDGNLTTAEATAHRIAAALAEKLPSPLSFTHTSPDELVRAFVDTVQHVRRLALRSQERYRAALERFRDFARSANITALDAVTEGTVEDFVRWLRTQKRPRNGIRVPNAKLSGYRTGGIKFIRSTCRTAFNWALRRRFLPLYCENPFANFGIEKLRDDADVNEVPRLFTPDEERKFFAACSPWQRALFTILAGYGMRIGELNHLLIEDVDFANKLICIRSKPEMLWWIKTRRTREVPLVPETELVFRRAIGKRRAGFVFLNEGFTAAPSQQFTSDVALRQRLKTLRDELLQRDPNASERACLREIVAFCRRLGQIPEHRLQAEFCKVTRMIGRPDLTRVHDLRHLCATRAQEGGMNPLIVQQITGHESLGMLARYSHLGVDARRAAVRQVLASLPKVPEVS